MKPTITPVTAISVLLAGTVLTGCGAQDDSAGDAAPSSASAHQSPSGTGVLVEGTYTGPQTLELNTAAVESTPVFVTLTCISPGTLSLQDGTEMECADSGEGTTSTTQLTLSSGQDTIEVRTDDAAVQYEVKVSHESKLAPSPSA